MCGRYAVTSAPEAIRALFGYPEQPNFPPRYNIAPTQPIAIVRLVEKKRQFALVRWGLLPAWVKDPKNSSLLINARGESLTDKPAFQAAMKRRRCLIPADGFYEWTGSKSRRPFLLRARKRGLIAFAGIWECWRDREGAEIDTVAILTCAANATVTPLHNRMPVVLPADAFEAWLDCAGTEAEAALALLQPTPDDLLEAIEIDPKINDSRHDEPDIQQPLQPSLL
jgi:putative SOS response-associated peptidase YedK